jgi:hypothetical protein
MPRHQQSSGGTGGVVTPLRRDDRSGLLDIHALSSVIDAQRRGRPSASSGAGTGALAALPAFGSPWGLQAVPPAAPVGLAKPSKPVVVGPDNRPLYVMIAALSLAVASLGAYVLLRPAPTVVVERSAVPVVVAEPAEPEAQVPEAEPPQVPVVAAVEPDPSEAEIEATPAPEAERPRARVGRTPRPKVTPTPVPKVTPKEELSVECIIDPSKCGKGKSQPRADKDDPPPSSKDLPAAPSSSQIRTAMAEVKGQAKACGARHSGHDGEKVRVKLSVVGATGKVTSAQALDDHAGTPLGRCVADALSKATLPRFSKPQAGVVYAVTL